MCWGFLGLAVVVNLHYIYKNYWLPNTYTASFTLNWKSESVSVGGGEFNDTFTFLPGHLGLNEVDMFEALG